MTTNPPTSVRNDTATTPTPVTTPAAANAAAVVCGFCGTGFVPVGRQQWCSDRCRQAVWRRRTAVPRPVLALPAKPDTVYECPKCATHYLGEQYCPDCFTFCRNIGPGGPCPHCGDPVAVGDLTDVLPAPTRRSQP